MSVELEVKGTKIGGKMDGGKKIEVLQKCFTVYNRASNAACKI